MQDHSSFDPKRLNENQATLDFDAQIAPAKARPFRLPVYGILSGIPTDDVADIMNVSRRTVERWMQKGVTGWTGDKIAVKVAGKDGYSVWGADFDRAFESVLDADPVAA